MTESLDIWKQTLTKLNTGLDLEIDEIQSVMRQILQGDAEIENIKSFLLALKAKGETAEEVSALVAEMYRHSAPISITERALVLAAMEHTPSISPQLRRSSQPLQAPESSNMVTALFHRVQVHLIFWKRSALFQVLLEGA
jgi:hypothetical protein